MPKNNTKGGTLQSVKEKVATYCRQLEKQGFLLWLGTIFSDMVQKNPNFPSCRLVQAAERTWKQKLLHPLKEHFKQLATYPQLEVGSDKEKESHDLARAAYIQRLDQAHLLHGQYGEHVDVFIEIVVKGCNHK